MLPHLVLRVRRAVRRWAVPQELATSDPQTEASWQRMIERVHGRNLEIERRMVDIERELNRLGLH